MVQVAPRRRLARPGVKVLTLSDGRHVARYRDPLSGKWQQQSLDKLGLGNAEARRRWAVTKASSLASIRAAITSGGAVAERVTMTDAVTTFLGGYTKQATIDGYKMLLDRFARWAAGVGVRFMQDLTAPHLTRFGDHYRQDSVVAPVAGGKRGAKQATKRRRASASINKALTVCKAFLGWARRRGWTPNLTGDGIRDNLRPVKVERNAIEFLRPPQVRSLLEAVQRHDAARFELTRAEHDGIRPPGTTPRYEPAAPFVLLTLLLGTRLSELIGLQWDEVDLKAGEIRLPARRVKTGMARTITLQETPSAVELLGRLRVKTRGDRVFPAWGIDLAKATRRRLLSEFKAPLFGWQVLRRTTAAVLTNAASIYGASSAYRSARRAGHSVVVAERHYVDLLRELPAKATTFESALGIEGLAQKIVDSVAGKVEAVSVAE
jgi:integrase